MIGGFSHRYVRYHPSPHRTTTIEHRGWTKIRGQPRRNTIKARATNRTAPRLQRLLRSLVGQAESQVVRLDHPSPNRGKGALKESKGTQELETDLRFSE